MKNTLLAIVLGIAILGIAIIAGIQPFKPRPSSQKEMQRVPTTERLRWFAQQAKNEKLHTVTIPSLVVQYNGDSTEISLDEAIEYSSVVVAELLEKKSYEQNGNNIITWNRFRIEEVLFEASKLPCPNCVPEKPPQEMLPLQPGEFLLSKSGGKLIIDGVNVEQKESGFPEFLENSKYLLFLALRPTGTAETLGGPVGVFRLNAQGKALPVGESSHLLRKEFKERFGNSPDRLRTRLRKK